MGGFQEKTVPVFCDDVGCFAHPIVTEGRYIYVVCKLCSIYSMHVDNEKHGVTIER